MGGTVRRRKLTGLKSGRIFVGMEIWVFFFSGKCQKKRPGNTLCSAGPRGGKWTKSLQEKKVGRGQREEQAAK